MKYRIKRYIVGLLAMVLSVYAQQNGFEHDHRVVPFYKSMEPLGFDVTKNAIRHHEWDLVKQAYDAYNQRVQHEEHNQLRIPKIIHHVWVGSPLPEYVRTFRQSWFKYHPDWTFILWAQYPEAIDGDVILTSFEQLHEHLAQADYAKRIIMDMSQLKLHNHVAYTQRAHNYGEKSDIIRYEALYHVGGLYVDTDFECLKSFDFLHYSCDFFAGIAYDRPVYLLNGLIGTRAGCPIAQKAMLDLHDRQREGKGSLAYSGPYYFTSIFFDRVPHMHEDSVVVFPLTYFYPLPHRVKHQANVRDWIRPESYAVHYWKVSWLKKGA